MTPETDNTCHYLWAFARDWCLDKQVITTRLREGVSGVFFEDEVMLEAQQRGIEANPGYDFYNLNIDAGAMWTRRMIVKMIAEETDDPRYRASAGDATEPGGHLHPSGGDRGRRRAPRCELSAEAPGGHGRDTRARRDARGHFGEARVRAVRDVASDVRMIEIEPSVGVLPVCDR